MPEQVIVLGAGGHGKVVADAILSAGDTVLGFLDDDPARNAVWDIPVLGPFGAWESWADRAVFVFGLGNNALRRELSGQMQVKWHTAVHPAARVGRGVVLGEGPWSWPELCSTRTPPWGPTVLQYRRHRGA